jgi:hypothetical protein
MDDNPIEEDYLLLAMDEDPMELLLMGHLYLQNAR